MLLVDIVIYSVSVKRSLLYNKRAKWPWIAHINFYIACYIGIYWKLATPFDNMFFDRPNFAEGHLVTISAK